LLDSCRVSSANDLLHLFYTDKYPRDEVAQLAPRVDQAAQEGDRVANEILGAAAQQLAAITASVRQQLFGNTASVSYVGGVFQSRFVLDRFKLLVEIGGSTVIAPLHGPDFGALLEAYRAGK